MSSNESLARTRAVRVATTCGVDERRVGRNEKTLRKFERYSGGGAYESLLVTKLE